MNVASKEHTVESIRLLRDFHEKLLTSHPNEYIRVEDRRLVELDKVTEKWSGTHEYSSLSQ